MFHRQNNSGREDSGKRRRSTPHLHAREVHRFVHQDPRGGLKARRDGHRSIVRDEATRLRVDLLDVQGGH